MGAEVRRLAVWHYQALLPASIFLEQDLTINCYFYFCYGATDFSVQCLQVLNGQ